MRSKIALLLSIVLIFTLALPMQGFAAEMSEGLENAIKIARTKFSIPDDYKFSSSISTSGNKKVFYLSYTSKDSVNPTYMNISVDENGMIVNYNKYTPYDYKQTKKLPGISRQDAEAKAGEYIEKIAPGLIKELQYQEAVQDGSLNSSYFFNYYRVVNGIPFYNDRVYVTVNRDTGELQDYSRNWTDKVDFPPASGYLSLEEAQKAYAKNLGLRLIYRSYMKDNVMTVFPAYVPVYNNSSYAVNALTGERVRLSGNYYYDGAGDVALTFSEEKASLQMASGGIRLNPEELDAVQNAAKLISQDGAEKVARAAKFLGITDGHKLQSNYLGTNWPDKNEYTWSLYFNKPADENNYYEDYINVSINAKTGEITSFYRSVPYSEGARPKNDMAKVKAEMDAFLKEYYPQYLKELEYDELAAGKNVIYAADKLPNNYNFTYTRIANGVPFPDNGVYINYDNLTGIISSFNLNWYTTEFPAVDKVIGLEAAHKSLFERVGLALEYKLQYPEGTDRIYTPDSVGNASMLLTYALNQNKPLYIDANTGLLQNYDGTEYKEPEKIEYTDIKGHFAEKQIMVLADNGIYLEGKEFKPGEAITQLDFMALLSKTLNYYGPVISVRSTDKELDDLYAFLLREGIVKDGEWKPTQTVTREEAVKYIIRALKYDKVADISGIFNITFADKAAISADLTGYVAIASGLGIINGDGANFNPARYVTRGETAVMIYNYLQS
jgi:hypothetical protein